MIKANLAKIKAHPKYDYFMHWGKAISITGGAQILVQATGLIAGIIIIRLLPVQEYAYYTLANTMLGTMTVLADGGISTGVMSEGGKVWQEKEKLGAVLATGLHLRKRFALASLCVSIPILGYLLYHQGAGLLSILLIVFALIPSFYAALSDSLLEIVPKLHQDIKPLQGNQLKVSIFRLVLSAASLFVFPFTFIAVLANGIPRLYGNFGLKKIGRRFVDYNRPISKGIENKILKIVRRAMPEAIYYCFSGQINIWMISLYGNNTSVAQIGALGRITMLMTFFTVIFNMLITPRFAKIQKPELISKLKWIFIFNSMLGIILATIIYLFSTQILTILGSNYANLETEMMLSFIASFVGTFSGISFALFMNRGWAIHPVVSVSISLLSLIVGIFFFNISTLKGVLFMNIFTSLVQFILNSFFVWIKSYKSDKSAMNIIS